MLKTPVSHIYRNQITSTSYQCCLTHCQFDPTWSQICISMQNPTEVFGIKVIARWFTNLMTTNNWSLIIDIMPSINFTRDINQGNFITLDHMTCRVFHEISCVRMNHEDYGDREWDMDSECLRNLIWGHWTLSDKIMSEFYLNSNELVDMLQIFKKICYESA